MQRPLSNFTYSDSDYALPAGTETKTKTETTETLDHNPDIPDTSDLTSMIRIKISSGQNSPVFSNVLLDTGSHFSLMCTNYAKSLGFRLERLQQGDIRQVIVADSQPVAIDAKVRMKLHIGPLVIYEWAYCVHSLSHNVIVGLKFMLANSVNLLNDRGIVKIRGAKIPFISRKDYLSLAVVKSDVVIPPRSFKMIFLLNSKVSVWSNYFLTLWKETTLDSFHHCSIPPP